MIVASLVVLWIAVLALYVPVILLYRQFGLLYVGSSARVRMQGIPPGKQAPANLPVLIDGQTATLDWRAAGAGRGSLVILGTQTCPYCADVIEALDGAVATTGAALDFVFIDRLPAGAALHRDIPRGRRWRYAISPDGEAHEQFGVDVSPFAFVVSEGGTVLSKGIVNHLDGLLQVVEDAFQFGDSDMLKRPSGLDLALVTAPSDGKLGIGHGGVADG
jgi:hypothetical protein